MQRLNLTNVENSFKSLVVFIKVFWTTNTIFSKKKGGNEKTFIKKKGSNKK
jgi:hypothetical protein